MRHDQDLLRPHDTTISHARPRMLWRLCAIALLWLASLSQPLGATAAQTEPSGEVRFAIHITLAPSWFDPAETPSSNTPYLVLYLLHDALVKPMPGQRMAPSLAESWTESPDGLVYEFKLREGLTFHNGDPFTAEDVRFSFERYHGGAAKDLHSRVQTVDILDPYRIRFVLKAPWPDFMTFYGTIASGAGWIVPKKYLEKVGVDQFKQQPVGLGPYKIVSYKPGIEIIAEANTAYWRKVPEVKRLIFQSVPEESTRLAMLKRGEADITYALQGQIAEEVGRTANLTLQPVMLGAIWWLDFPEQWDPKSPWHDQRVRQAASLAIDRQALNEAEMLGHSRLSGALIPPEYEFALELPTPPYDPAKARQLLAEAGYPNGFDAGELTPIAPYFSLAESVISYLQAIGIKSRLRTMERATFFSMRRERSLKGLILDGPGVAGNGSTWLDGFAMSWGSRSSGGYADVEELFKQQSHERDRSKREAMLHDIQRRLYERVALAPFFQFAWLTGFNRRVAQPALGLIQTYPYTAPYEDIRLAK
ncbi:MAG: ABC transporter substrate-binding protein [Candidatus Tectimicrobiota bacterium]